MLKIITISDTHGRHHNLVSKNLLPKGDMIIHSGDSTPRGAMADVEEFLRWYGDLDYKHKILIAGNHDWAFVKEEPYIKELCKNYDIKYLNDSGVVLEGIKIWGSPVQPEFHNWAFNKKRGAEIRKHWDMIPDDIDILITHGPAKGVLDFVNKPFYNSVESVGCKDLLDAILRIKPSLHVCGHIHESRGVSIDKQTGTPITFVNASSVDQYYKLYEERAFCFEWNKVIMGNSLGKD